MNDRQEKDVCVHPLFYSNHVLIGRLFCHRNCTAISPLKSPSPIRLIQIALFWGGNLDNHPLKCGVPNKLADSVHIDEAYLNINYIYRRHSST